MENLYSTCILNNGIKIPRLGFGTFRIPDNEVTSVVKEAIKVGYRHIDTAMIYENEAGIGRAITESDINRREIFLTSKLWDKDQGYEKTLKAFELSIKKLKTDYLDLYLVHWPTSLNKKTWKALEKLYNEKKIRAIGVSNFHINHLKEIIENFEISPMVNQIEFHPRLQQKDLIQYCNTHNIILEAWAPLMQGEVSKIPLLKNLANKYKKTIAQIILRWDLQMGFVTIPKSVKKDRIIENTQIFDFKLSKEDMDKIAKLDKDHSVLS